MTGSLAAMLRMALVFGVLAGLAPAVSQAPASAPDSLALTAVSRERGWVALTVSGPADGSVDVRELVGGRSLPVARLSLSGGKAELERATPWRCRRSVRRFRATLQAPGAAPRAATATIATPSCERRLRMIVVPARVRPGQSATVRVTDSWHLGGISTSLCVRSAGATTGACRRVRLPEGTITRRAHVRASRPGRRAIALRSTVGQRLDATVDVRRDARLRVLVTGDSLVFGLGETIGRDLGRRGSVKGDAYPGFGISTPAPIDWPTRARRTARSDRPDVTIVLLGSADAGYPLKPASGAAVPCCDAPWKAEYARRARSMMAAWLRDGRGLVYWVLVPAPRSPDRAKVVSVENDAARQAAARFDDGVRVIDRVAAVLAPDDRFTAAIRVHGRERTVRDPDGVHFTNLGIRITTNILKDALRDDGLLR